MKIEMSSNGDKDATEWRYETEGSKGGRGGGMTSVIVLPLPERLWVMHRYNSFIMNVYACIICPQNSQ